jgi:hypothetical protein
MDPGKNPRETCRKAGRNRRGPWPVGTGRMGSKEQIPISTLMKLLKVTLLLASALLPSSDEAEAGFFRVSGPVATTMTGIAADGMVTWTNATTNATFTVQRAAVLSGATSWHDYVQVPVTGQ